MFVSNNTLEGLASRFVNGRRTLDDLSQEFGAFVPTITQAAAATLSSGSGSAASQGNAQGDTGYNESFARMMLNLKTQGQSSLSASVADGDNGVSTEQGSNLTSTQQAFLDYMQQPASERLREQLTGVSKQQYEAMSPEQQKAVDQKFTEALKQQQEIAQQDINTRIKALKAGLIA
ncbi:hypothetical protein NJC40_03950 [Pseudomonas sp. 21LCFQ02]|uniref:hypothetical protein n=1 Tax=unclassified Pseudomonas TaxID=196821 RepID=UPI0004F7F409|nr:MULTISPECIES: hypothetical protein [unclassified Pseudomonas]MCO8166930.1 hypothetical protein [Pseudomonas sp. 21LCFQ02]MCQ9423339.1 hypothetical protein [Pseudomonas sp. LJDD11]BAP44697.1 putative uncharacterized protein [Pseudomonas sp. StFLB209]